MKREEIQEKIKAELYKWIDIQRKAELYVTFSPKAEEFLCLMIENIVDDPSRWWVDDSIMKGDTAQEYAITLIPTALNELYFVKLKFPPEYPDYLFRHEFYESRKIHISSWEIWHALSKIVHHFCFIPKRPRQKKIK